MARAAIRRRSLTDPRHLLRFLKNEAHIPVEDIAKTERVSVRTVRDSIEMVEGYRTQNSTAEVDFAIRSLIIGAMPQAGETLDGLLTATELVEDGDAKTGRKRRIRQEDKTTRLEALRVVTQLVGTIQPKGPAVVANLTQTNQTAVISSAEGYEERLRRLRQRAQEHNALPPEVTAVPVSVDQEMDDDDGEEEDE